MITLFASPATLQYKKDVFSVIALPRKGNYQFRYVSEYIDPNALSLFRSNKILDLEAIIALKSVYTSPKNEKYCVPLRLALIKSVENTADGYVINFEVGGYPSFSIDFNPKTFDELNDFFVDKFLSFESTDYTVWNKSLPTINDDKEDDDENNWGKICRYINLIPEFKNYHLIKFSTPYIEKWKKGSLIRQEIRRKNNIFQVTEGECFNFDIEYFTKEYNRKNNKSIQFLYDEKVISQAKGLRSKIQSRYGCIKVGFQPLKVPNNTISELFFSTKNYESKEVPIEISVPFIVCKKRSKVIIQTVLSSFGAVLIALPAIVKDYFPLWATIIFAILGVALIGITNYFQSKE